MLVEVNNYSQVELYARIILTELPDDPHAILAIAWANLRANLLHFAVRYFHRLDDRAIDLSNLVNELKIPKEDYQKLVQLASRSDEPESADKLAVASASPRYLLIKAWGYGFWSDVLHVIGGLMLAELTGRQPLVHWGKNSLYSVDPANNAFTDYFAPVGPSIDMLISSGLECFPPKWRCGEQLFENVNKTKGEWSKVSGLNLIGQRQALAVMDYYIGVLNLMPYIESDSPLYGMSLDQVYRYLINKYLVLKPELIDRARDFSQQNLGDSPFLAIHVRGSDKVGEFKVVDKFHNKYQQLIADQLKELPENSKIFLMTDDNRLLKNYLELFGDRIVTTDCLRTDTRVGVHYQAGNRITKAAEEVIVDTLVAAGATRFVGNGYSNPSIFVYYLGRWGRGECRLIGGNRMRHYNTHLYKTITVV